MRGNGEMAVKGDRGRVACWLWTARFAFFISAAYAQDKPAVPVEAAKVMAAPLSEQVTAVGTIFSNEAVTVRLGIPGRLRGVMLGSEFPGRLEDIHFQEGQPIERGSPLFTLEDSVYRAQLADAEAKLKLAEQTHKRRATLLSNQYATAQSADESASAVAVNTAAVELARVQLDKAHIVAPFSGIVGLRRARAGGYITPR